MYRIEKIKKKHHRKKHHKKVKYLTDLNELDGSELNRRNSKKSIDIHLKRLINGLTAYLNSFNLTLDSALSKLQEIKSKAISTLFPYEQSKVIMFHKYYATFHNVESNFFIQSTSLPFVEPNQIYLGCPQPFCFLTTFDDLTFNPITNELLIFRNQYYWKFKIDKDSRKKQLPYLQINYPRLVDAKLISNDNQDKDVNMQTQTDFPKEFPTYIDAATYVTIDNFYYLIVIKDGWVYVYVPQN